MRINTIDTFYQKFFWYLLNRIYISHNLVFSQIKYANVWNFKKILIKFLITNYTVL